MIVRNLFVSGGNIYKTVGLLNNNKSNEQKSLQEKV